MLLVMPKIEAPHLGLEITEGLTEIGPPTIARWKSRLIYKNQISPSSTTIGVGTEGQQWSASGWHPVGIRDLDYQPKSLGSPPRCQPATVSCFMDFVYLVWTSM